MFEIYTKDNCSYCTQLKALMDFHFIDYTVKNVSEGVHTKEEIQERVGPEKKINVVPQIFFNGKYLGGYLETVEFIAYDKYKGQQYHRDE